MKIRTKIILILSCTLFVSLAGAGLYFVDHYKKAFRDIALQRVESSARANAYYVKDYLETQKALTEHIRNFFPVEDYMAGNVGKVNSFLANHYKDLPYFQNGFFFLDQEGDLKADYPHHPELIGNNYSYREYFQQTMKEKRGIIARPYQSKRTGAKVLTFTAYLETPEGEPLGMIGLSADLVKDPRLSEVRLQKHGEKGYNYVYDKSRLMILHPKTNRMVTRDVKVGANKMYDAALEGFTGGAETVNSRGIEMFVAFYPVEGSDWILASQQPVEEAMKTLTYSIRTMVMVVVCIILVAVAVGLLLIQRSMRHLVQLEEVTESLKVPKGDLSFGDQHVEEEAEKLTPLLNHPEFGPLASKIAELYKSLGGSLATTKKKTDDLNEAYEHLKISQSQILQQEKMASIGQLAAGVAHEINNPMGFITSNLCSLSRYLEKIFIYQDQLEEWLQKANEAGFENDFVEFKKSQKIDFLKEDIPDLIEESISGSGRVQEIVKNLKSFSRVDQAEFSEVDINECLESTISIAWNELKYKTELERDFGKLPPLQCHPQQLNQVFLNILVNSAQAIEQDGQIRVKTFCEDDRIHIVISDNGCGIPEEIRDRIFEPFFTTKDVGAGTGLGMSISYEIIKKHHGEILLESEVGKGTTFTIVLPLSGEGTENV